MTCSMTDTICERASDASGYDEQHICLDVLVMEPGGVFRKRYFGMERSLPGGECPMIWDEYRIAVVMSRCTGGGVGVET